MIVCFNIKDKWIVLILGRRGSAIISCKSTFRKHADWSWQFYIYTSQISFSVESDYRNQILMQSGRLETVLFGKTVVFFVILT